MTQDNSFLAFPTSLMTLKYEVWTVMTSLHPRGGRITIVRCTVLNKEMAMVAKLCSKGMWTLTSQLPLCWSYRICSHSASRALVRSSDDVGWRPGSDLVFQFFPNVLNGIKSGLCVAQSSSSWPKLFFRAGFVHVGFVKLKQDKDSHKLVEELWIKMIDNKTIV